MKRKYVSSDGFTLLEILVAVFIFAVTVSTIFGSFKAVLGNVNTIEEGTAQYEMAKHCLNRMVSDINSLYLTLPPIYSPPDFDDEPDPYRILGETDSIGSADFSKLRFTSRAHLPLENNTQNGIAQIVYYIQETADNRFVLRRSDTLYPYEPVKENQNDPILCENMVSLNFLYYDDEGTEHEFWDSDSEEFGYATPKAIKIKLKLGDEARALLLATMISLPVYREKKE